MISLGRLVLGLHIPRRWPWTILLLVFGNMRCRKSYPKSVYFSSLLIFDKFAGKHFSIFLKRFSLLWLSFAQFVRFRFYWGSDFMKRGYRAGLITDLPDE